jgi:ABC-type lipoprotein release transport system permease subunit
MLASDMIAKYIFKTEHWATEKLISINVIYGIATGVMVLMIINIFAVIKLYRSEFKTNMIAN